MSEKKVFEYQQGARKFVVEIGEIAKQANGAALVRFNDTAVISAAVFSKNVSTADFFPLTVLYQEKLYAAGKIPGGFLKREGRPTDHETLTARLIDRPIRPLFAEGFRNEVQVINTVVSANPDNSSQMCAMLASSIALTISDIPFNGPIAGVQVGRVNGEFIINPTVNELEESDINLIVAGTKDAINMVEAGSKEVSEEDMLDALMFGHEEIKKLVAFQEQIQKEIGKEKYEVELYSIPAEIDKLVKDMAEDDLKKAVSIKEKLERYGKIDEINLNTLERLEELWKDLNREEHDQNIKFANQILEGIVANEVRRLIIEDKIRPDGRKVDEIRPLESRVDVLERVHGSALFTRGQTQSLGTVTLGSLNEFQIIDGLGVEEGKRFIFHYNFPAYSVGETGRYGSPGRREIGHGALAERALLQVIPSEDDFPYTIRVVSEILESNGSSSQASICSGTMALMAAGVPIKAPVAGIAMGLISDEKNYTILTDIQGMEDHLGDMDFKVAGTREGVCALQMDIKILGINREILEKALAQARKARMQILDVIEGCIPEPRKEVSKYAPKIHQMMIDVDKIREVIGPGGKKINEIIEACDNVQIDIEQTGKVVIYHQDMEPIKKAAKMIEDIVRVAKVGEIYEGPITRIEAYGIFVELFPGCEGMVHVSKLAYERVNHPKDLFKLGDIVKVVVTEIDEKGKVALSRKDLLPKPEKVKDDGNEEKKEDKKKGKFIHRVEIK